MVNLPKLICTASCAWFIAATTSYGEQLFQSDFLLKVDTLQLRYNGDHSRFGNFFGDVEATVLWRGEDGSIEGVQSLNAPDKKWAVSDGGLFRPNPKNQIGALIPSTQLQDGTLRFDLFLTDHDDFLCGDNDPILNSIENKPSFKISQQDWARLAFYGFLRIPVQIYSHDLNGDTQVARVGFKLEKIGREAGNELPETGGARVQSLQPELGILGLQDPLEQENFTLELIESDSRYNGGKGLFGWWSSTVMPSIRWVYDPEIHRLTDTDFDPYPSRFLVGDNSNRSISQEAFASKLLSEFDERQGLNVRGEPPLPMAVGDLIHEMGGRFPEKPDVFERAEVPVPSRQMKARHLAFHFALRRKDGRFLANGPIREFEITDQIEAQLLENGSVEFTEYFYVKEEGRRRPNRTEVRFRLKTMP